MGSNWRSGSASDHGPTLKQLRFIRDLGGDVNKALEFDTWQKASDYIDELKRQPKSPSAGTHFTLMATPRQVDYVKSLGGDEIRAAAMSRDQVSAYITELRQKKAAAPQPTEPTGHKSTDPRLDLLNGLLEGVRDGYYAVQADDTDPLTFMRVSRPKKGQYAGALKIQTKHSDDLKLAAVRWPSGQWSMYTGNYIIDKLLLLVVDPTTAGIQYSKHYTQCMRCTKDLTDERSRHYGIGPECETYWPHIIKIIDERNNSLSYETLRARSML